MASKEAFLPVSTEDPDQTGGSVPIVPSYSPSGPGSGSTFAGSLSVDDGNDEFPNSANHHVLCFNYCCDFRRAVLVVNGISIVIKLLLMLGVAVGVSYLTKNLDVIEADIVDDDARQQVDLVVNSGGIVVFEAFIETFEMISIGLHACGIYGALHFKRWGIITAGSTYAISLFVGIVTFDIGNIIVSSLFLYPHYFMHKLMKAGIMTDYNYHKIASCCGDRQM